MGEAFISWILDLSGTTDTRYVIRDSLWSIGVEELMKFMDKQ